MFVRDTAAGDHPDLIVYGEMSWSSHHIGQDGSEDALHRGGSNVWINALPPATTWCNSITVTGAGDPSWNGVYYRQIDAEHPADGIAFMMDDTHEIYKWGGAWRFADYGVRTYYVASEAGLERLSLSLSLPVSVSVSVSVSLSVSFSFYIYVWRDRPLRQRGPAVRARPVGRHRRYRASPGAVLQLQRLR